MNALLIGINYTGTGHQLQGCIFDIIEMKSLITDAYRFDVAHIVVLRDDDPANRPTKARILQELTKLVANSDASSNTFLHYSGHGTQITDSVDESDQLDECIVPCDYATAGYITDDEINAIFKPLKGTGLALFDCCRSGTIMDLPFSGTAAAETQSQGFYCFSGCTDAQDVLEGTQGSATGLPQGAMTLAFINTIRSLQYYPPVATLLSTLQAQLLAGGYSQTPQLTSTVPVSPTTPFPFLAPVAQLSQVSVQLQTQTELAASLQQQIPILEAQIAVLQQQVALLPALEASAQLLSVVQTENQVLQGQLETLPFLQQQAALVPKLQAQVQLIPGLQNQIASLMYQQVLVQQLQRELAAARR